MKRLFGIASYAAVIGLLCGADVSAAGICAAAGQAARGKSAGDIVYSARMHAPGYRFSVDGVPYELIRTQFTAQGSRKRFAVIHPVLLDAEAYPRFRDFFVSVETRPDRTTSCSDVLFGDESAVHRVRVDDESTASVAFGDLQKTARSLESIRTLAATLRVRVDGTEMTLSAGFSAKRSLSLAECAKGLADSYGFVEYGPGRIKVACFPADPASADHVAEIDWRVDYRWPPDPSALLDALIDYVYVEAI